MRAKDRVKLCPFCEGNISFDALVCPYCGSHLDRAKNEKYEPKEEVQSLQEHLEALYQRPSIPQHREKKVDHVLEEEKPFYHDLTEDNTVSSKSRDLFDDQLDLFNYVETEQSREVDSTEESKESHEVIWSLFFLSMGSQLLILSILILLFSTHGRVVLEWKSRYWIVYFLLSLPSLCFGWHLLRGKKGFL